MSGNMWRCITTRSVCIRRWVTRHRWITKRALTKCPETVDHYIITYLLLLRGGFKERSAMILAFLAAALTTPLGMLISYPIISKIDKPMLGALLSLSAGALIYVGATHLLPKAEQEHKRYSFVALGGGVLVAIIIVISKT